jgi:hypothetical protein
MPVDFRIARVAVDRFRGIREFELPLAEGAPTYVIGGNNTGKSTLLNAVALALRGGAFYQFEPGEFDFFHEPDGQAADAFSVTIYFEAAEPSHLPAVQGVGSPVFVQGVRVTGKHTKNRYTHRRVLLDQGDDVITYSQRTALKADDKATYKEHHLGWSPVYARIDEIREHLPEVWLLRPDNLERSLYVWQTGPLNRLSKILSERFLETKWSFEFGEKNKKTAMPDGIRNVHKFFRAAVDEFPFWKEDMKPKLEKALGTYLGRTAGVALVPSIQTIEEWLAQQLTLAFCAESGGAMTPLRHMGDGWQALVRLAALEALQEYEIDRQQPVFLLYEEPETYLHPHLRRKLRDVLERLTAAGWMCVCSTHAPEFISFSRPQQIVRLWRSGSKTEHGRVLSDAVPEGPKLQEKLNERGTQEFLFSNRVILCEGKDDVFGILLFLEKRGVDVDGKGITLVDVGGVGNFADYADIARNFRIPWCAVSDEDLEDNGKVKIRTAQAREKLDKLKSAADVLPIWPGTLERCLGQNKVDPEWQQHHLGPKTLAEIRTAHPSFYQTCEQIVSWIG